MKTSIDGLILKEMTVSDNDRIVTVLTKEKGIISCYVRRAKHIKSRNFAPTNLLTFSRMNIYNGRGMYIIDEADVIMRFFDVDPDIKRFALSQYFSELVIKSVPQEVESDGQLELMLNCLHLLSNTLRPCDIIKTVFEIRVFKVTDWDKGVGSDKYTLIYKDNRYAYTFINHSPESELAMENDEIKTAFSLLDKNATSNSK